MMINTRISINGAGRIGRRLIRLLAESDEIKIVSVKDISDIHTIAHLLKYDSIHGVFPTDVLKTDSEIIIGKQRFKFYQIKSDEMPDWSIENPDILIDCTGHYLSSEKAQLHINGGAKKLILSAPSTDIEIKMIVMGVNDHIIKSDDFVLSNASCTTNNAAPLLWLLDNHFKIKSAFVTTVHSYTSDQKLTDSPHNDLRRARSAPLSIIPTTTGAAKALNRIFPHLEGKIGGSGIRVPVPNGSLTEITCTLEKTPDVTQINQLFRSSAENELKGILQYQQDPIVSADVIGNPYSCIYDSLLTSVVGSMVKVTGWYDNENGYTNRLIDLIKKINTLNK